MNFEDAASIIYPIAGADTDAAYLAYQLTNGPRQHVYGHPLDDYTRVSRIFEAITGIEMTPVDCQFMMLSVKLARLHHNMKTANVLHRDSLVDAQGYLNTIDKTWRAMGGTVE
jgi:hypothetical protein